MLRLNIVKGQFCLRLAKTAAEEKFQMSVGCFALPVLSSMKSSRNFRTVERSIALYWLLAQRAQVKVRNHVERHRLGRYIVRIIMTSNWNTYCQTLAE